MQATCDIVFPYVHMRKQFNKPLGHFQLIQGKLADMYCKLSASRSFVYTIARACDNGIISNKDCAVSNFLIISNNPQTKELYLIGHFQCYTGRHFVFRRESYRSRIRWNSMSWR